MPREANAAGEKERGRGGERGASTRASEMDSVSQRGAHRVQGYLAHRKALTILYRHGALGVGLL